MKKGFTLLELIVVIIIIGILGTLGLTQYTRMVEKARGAEAKVILGDLRKKAIAYRLQNGTITGATNAALDISPDPGDTPSACAGQASHYFSYTVVVPVPADPSITFTATRCGALTGKTPGAAAPTAGQTLTLISNLLTGVDSWEGTGPWD